MFFLQLIINLKLQEKSTSLTQVRKQKGKKAPEDLATVDDIKGYKCAGSHTVSIKCIA